MASPAAPVETFRADYAPLARVVSSISMDFQIFDGCTTVTAVMTIAPNAPAALDQDMILDGDESCVKLLSLSLNGRELSNNTDYTLAPGKLIIKASTLQKNSVNVLTTVVELVPEDNTQLSGLYKSGPMYCSQCEAMGFRRITYYPDRPDNMAIFENVRIEADKERYPVLLSNGNLLEQGDIEGTTTTRHYSIWSDPFPKPSYLFCVVAGKLGSIRDTYSTMSGREVKLEIFSEAENVKKLDYAMQSLKRSMKWDEDTFGLEYDLGMYNIVAVNDFNMGAMENKGLNIFNTAYVLADPATATDGDFELVEGVIAHEYFHNVSCIACFKLGCRI
jgi:aminopeptidase N